MMYGGIALLCLIIVPGSFSDDDILKFMSPEEIRQIFHTDHDFVPKFEIVKINFTERLHKRNLPAGSKLHIRAFGQDINLWLHPGNTVLAGRGTPIYYATYNPNKPMGVEYQKRDGLMNMVGRIFEDPYWVAAFVIGSDQSGNPRVNGHIASKRMAVRSLPTRVAEEYRRRRRSIGDSDDLDSAYHIVFETTDEYEGSSSELPLNMTIVRARIARSAPAVIPDTLYVKVLVVIEYSLYRDFGNDIYGLLEYILAFWNAVDLKYRSLESPAFRFHISGIVLSLEPQATPYISNHSLGPNTFNSGQALPAAKGFYEGVKDTFPLDSYNVAVTFTEQLFGTGGAAGLLGRAYVSTMCPRVDGRQSTAENSVSLFRDNGAFIGVFYVAHELGHIIGSPHDPKTADCLYTNGFLMSEVSWYTKNSSDFSSCSTEIMDAFVKNGSLNCLFNKPQIPGEPLLTLMPGRIKRLKDQCKALNNGAPCVPPNDPNYDICVNFYCLNDKNECTETRTSAADGTSCDGDNKFCLHMQCVSL